MYDHSFNNKTISKLFRDRDAKGIPSIGKIAFKKTQIALALIAARSNFHGSNPLRKFPLKGKDIFKFKNLSDDLVARKITQNLKSIKINRNKGRAAIVANLSLLLEEGTPYRLYRLDVRKFYESFEASKIKEKIRILAKCSPQCKQLLKSLLEQFASMGGTGLPRGLALSAVLSDILMHEFDKKISAIPDVYFYARYVDDIILLTSANEQKSELIKYIKGNLPSGLHLNNDKKKIGTISDRVQPQKAGTTPTQLLKFDYLGYEFKVDQAIVNSGGNKKHGQYNRPVAVDIAASKVKKIKTRIVKSFLDYKANKDWPLLLDRIKFLTENFSVFNHNAGGRRLAGIYHSYPQVPDISPALRALDLFLKNAVLSTKGRVFSMTAPHLNQKQRRVLLARSFARGHAEKTFVHFTAQRISDIQSCWNK